MAAKVERKKKSIMGAEISISEMPTKLHINLKEFKDLGNYDVGEKCKGSWEGTVTSVNKDEYGQTMTIELSNLTEGGDNNGDTED